MAKTHNKKRDFISILASMTDTEINDYIKNNGKGPKPVIMCVLINNKNK